MKLIHKTLKIFVQLVLFISIINFSFCWDKKSLIKKNYINKPLRSLQSNKANSTIGSTTISSIWPTTSTIGSTTTSSILPTTSTIGSTTTAPNYSDKESETDLDTIDTVKEGTELPVPIDRSTTTPDGNRTIDDNVPKKSSSGLSTGAICAIAIPTIAALLGVAAAAALCKGGSIPTPTFTPPTLPPPNYIDTSLDKFNVVHELPPQQPLPQPQVQPVHIEPQPIPRPIRPNYPINKVEPPLVNRAFQPMYNIQQPMQMVPVQQVQMVPVQQVEMVPVEEVVPVQQVVPGVVPLQQQVAQIPIPQVVETLPNISPADDLAGVGQVINPGQILQQGQVIQQGQALPDSSLGFSVQNLI